MSNGQLDLLALLSAPESTGITHVCLPDFSLACGIGYLERPNGDRVSFGWGKSAPTCVWCRSLGKAYCRAMSHRMQDRQAKEAA